MDPEDSADFLLLAGVGGDSAVGDRGCCVLLPALDRVPAAGDNSAVGRDTILLPFDRVPAEGDDNIGERSEEQASS
jgi:hypothetical protein